MPETETGLTAASADVASIVADAKRRLDGHLSRIDRLVRATPFIDPFPPTVFTAIGAARRDALTAFGRILRLETDDPAKELGLTWLSYVAAGLSSTHAALREQRLGASTARKTRRLARARFARIGGAFLELDRALGCPHGCKESS